MASGKPLFYWDTVCLIAWITDEKRPDPAEFVGIEREPKYFEIACERIRQAQAQGQMFAPESAALPTQQAMEL